MKVRLHKEVIIEPLLWRWHAWGLLVVPHTAALFLYKKLIPQLESFCRMPELHRKALDENELSGSSFVDLPVEKASEVSELLHKQLQNCSELKNLFQDIEALNKILINESNGSSLNKFYGKTPSSLKGCVEFFYDWLDSPQIRYIEPLLYELFDLEPYQELAISRPQVETRPFLLGTPRIGSEHLFLKVPFRNKGIDLLARSRTEAIDFEILCKELELQTEQIKQFREYFLQSDESSTCLPPSKELKVTYYGHACVLLENKGQAILIDPLVAYGHKSVTTKKDLTNIPDSIDYVLISHAHQDHLVIETLLQLRHKIGTIVLPRSQRGSTFDPCMKLMLEKIGFENVIYLDEFESIKNSAFKITSLPFFGEHADLMITSKASFLVEASDKKFLFAADSNNLSPELYKHLQKKYGNIETVFLGMECEGAPGSWLYGPLQAKQLPQELDQQRRLDGSNAEKASKLVDALGAKQVYVYAMGMEPWLSFMTGLSSGQETPQIKQSNLFESICLNKEIACERLYGSCEIAVKQDDYGEMII